MINLQYDNFDDWYTSNSSGSFGSSWKYLKRHMFLSRMNNFWIHELSEDFSIKNPQNRSSSTRCIMTRRYCSEARPIINKFHFRYTGTKWCKHSIRTVFHAYSAARICVLQSPKLIQNFKTYLNSTMYFKSLKSWPEFKNLRTK